MSYDIGKATGLNNTQVSDAIKKAHDMPSAEDVDIIAKYPQSPIHPQLNKITKGVVVCIFGTTEHLLVHMSKTDGIIETYTSDSVIDADDNNQGGESLTRVTNSKVATSATVGILTPRSISSSGVTEYSFSSTSTRYDESVGRTENSNTGAPIRKIKPTDNTSLASVSFGDRKGYELDQYKSVLYWVESGCEISFWCGSGEEYSDTVVIDYNTVNGTANNPVEYSIAGQTDDRYVLKPNEFESGFVAIKNNGSGKCYVMGVNIVPITEADPAENYDSLIAWYHEGVIDDGEGGLEDYWWLGRSDGANDFALRRTGGKTFGSVHGGHSNETLTFDNGRELIDSGSFSDGEFNYGKAITFISNSDLTDGTIAGTCRQEVTFFQGSHRIESSVDFGSEYSMRNMYTCMTCSNERFIQTIAPKILDVSRYADNEEIQLGQVSECVQYDPVNAHSIGTCGTWFNHEAVARDGMYILNRVSLGDKKVYIDSMDDSNKPSSGFVAITYHTFNG